MAKKIMSSVMILIGVILLLSVMVSAYTVTVTLIGGGTTASGVQNINASISGADTDGLNATNVTFQYKLSTDSIWTNIQTNHSYNLTSYTMGWNTSSLKDDSTYDIRAQAYNITGTILGTGTLSNLKIDNTNPICSQTDLSNNEIINPLTTTSLSVTATNASACSVTFGSDYYTLSESSDTCTFNLVANQVPNGIYDVKYTTSDSLDSTLCTTVTGVNIQRPTTSPIVSYAKQHPGQPIPTTKIPPDTKKSNDMVVWIIAGAIVIYLIYGMKKGK